MLWTDKDEPITGKETTTTSTDWVQVVRCKDCRFHENEMPGMVYCPATVGGWVEDDWFCKGGEGEDDAAE